MSLNGSLGLGVLLEAKDMATGVISRFGANLQSVAGKTSEASKAIGEHMRSFGLGLTIMGAGIAGLALLSPAIQEAKDFGKEIALVSTEVKAATFSQSEMKSVTRAMSAEFGRMPVDEAKSLYKAVALGANTAGKATEFMTTANRLAVAGNSELGVTVDALGGTLNAYHMSAVDAHVVSDAMFTAMKSGNTTVGAIAGAIGKVAPAAYEMGISLQETLGAMAVMTNKGVEASVAVSGLHGAMANIVHPSAAASAEAARLGIKFTGAALRAQGFQGFLHSITDSSKFTKDSLNRLFESVEGSGAMAMLAGDMGNVDAVMDEMSKSAGSTKVGFDIMNAQLDQQTKRFDALKAISMGLIGEALEPAGLAFVGLGNRILEAFNNLPAGVRDFIVKGAALVSTLLVIVGGAIALTAAMGMASVGMAAMGVTAGGVVMAVAPVVAVLAVAALAFYALREAYDRNIGGMATMVDGTISKIALTFKGLGQLFSDGGFSGDVMDEMNKADNQGIKAFAIRVFVTVARIQEALRGFAAGFFDAINAAKPAIESFLKALGPIGEAFAGLFKENNAEEAKASFDAFGKTGEKVGKVLGELVIKGIELATWTIDMGVKAKQLVDDLGGVGRILDVLKIALVVLVASKAAGALSSIGSAGIEAGLGIAKAAASAGMFSGAGLIGGAPGMVAALKNITSAAGAALGPVGAITAAIVALYLAYDQWNKLMKEWDENSSSQVWSKFKNDIGYTSDDEFKAETDKRQGVTRGDDFDRMKSVQAGEARLLPKAIDFYAPDVMPAVAAADAQMSSAAGPSADAIGAAVASGVAQMPGGSTTIIVQVGDEKIGEVVTKQQAGDQFRTGAPILTSF